MTIETEIKFGIPDQITFRALKNLTRLDEFQLQSAGTKMVTDQYLDTEDRRFLKAGFACRVRVDQNGQKIATLKALTPASAGLHRRQEIEQPVPSAEPAAWPLGNLRTTFEKIAQDAPLEIFFTIYQTRHKQYVLSGHTILIEASLDEVGHQLGKTDYYELELELLEAGTENDLRNVASVFQSHWALHQEQRSKFERGYELNYGRLPTMFDLTEHEKVVLARLVDRRDH